MEVEETKEQVLEEVGETEAVDWMLAAILERMKHYKLNYADLAGVAKISPEYMRKLFVKKPPTKWPADVRDSILKHLGISAKLIISSHEVDL